MERSMTPLKGSRTEENLKAAFAGESQPNRRYLRLVGSRREGREAAGRPFEAGAGVARPPRRLPRERGSWGFGASRPSAADRGNPPAPGDKPCAKAASMRRLATSFRGRTRI